MWGSILGIFSAGLKLIGKLTPSWEWKGGRAAAERDQHEETSDAQKRMDAVDAPDEQSTVDSLRRGKF